MSTPPDVQALIDELRADVFAACYDPRIYGRQQPPQEMALASAEYLARMLVMRGWRRPERLGELPRCPRGNPLCFDPDPHNRCWGVN